MDAVRRTVLALCLVLLTGAGCGTTGDKEKEATVTPDQANQELTETARQVLDAIAPGEQVDLNEDGPPTPCGGLGGNEPTKVKYGLIAKPTTPASADAFDQAAKALRARGYTVQQPETMGQTTTMTFTGDAVSGDLTQHGTGPLSLGAETRCLENPDN